MLGYRIGLLNDDLYIAVPKKYFDNNEPVEVTCEDTTKTYLAEDRATEATQSDKFGKGMTYTLYYFLWKKYD